MQYVAIHVHTCSGYTGAGWDRACIIFATQPAAVTEIRGKILGGGKT